MFILAMFYLSPCSAELFSAVLCNQQKGLQQSDCWPWQHHKCLLQHNASQSQHDGDVQTHLQRESSRTSNCSTSWQQLNHHICVPWALYSVTKYRISEKIGRFSNVVCIFITQALTAFIHVALSMKNISKKFITNRQKIRG
jgi:hypothetical protein